MKAAVSQHVWWTAAASPLSEAAMLQPKALAFDVFGTVVDWRGGVAREAAPWLASIDRSDVDAHAFADAWRRRYQPKLEEVRSGRRPFVVLDVLHREALEEVLRSHGVEPDEAGEPRLAELTLAWHRLDPWPDVVEGLTRLKRRFPIVTLSNGNLALILNMARRAGLPWDAVLGAEFSRAYKPLLEAYLATSRALALAPGELCLVAAHHSDLAAARACGLLTAYISRPDEYGGAPAPDADAVQGWDWETSSLIGLADLLGC